MRLFYVRLLYNLRVHHADCTLHACTWQTLCKRYCNQCVGGVIREYGFHSLQGEFAFKLEWELYTRVVTYTFQANCNRMPITAQRFSLLSRLIKAVARLLLFAIYNKNRFTNKLIMNSNEVNCLFQQCFLLRTKHDKIPPASDKKHTSHLLFVLSKYVGRLKLQSCL